MPVPLPFYFLFLWELSFLNFLALFGDTITLFNEKMHVKVLKKASYFSF